MIDSEQCTAHGKTSVNVSLICEDLCSDWGAQQGIRSGRGLHRVGKKQTHVLLVY